MKDFLHKPYLYLIIIILGVSLKFYKLDQKFFWDDEIATVLHTSGISMSDYETTIPVNQVFSRSFFDDILALNSRDLKIYEQLIGLSKMPQLTPGHYYYMIFWIRIFGDGYMSYRYFIIFIYLLSLPMLFLLTKKVFNSNLVAWLALCIYTTSPFFQVYAQEARYYTLWALGILSMHYIFLQACSHPSKKWWVLYVLVGFFAAHITILFALVFVMHLVYYFIFYKDHGKPFIISLGIIFMSTLPWLSYIFLNRADIQENLSWQTGFGAPTIPKLVLWQLEGLINIFLDTRYQLYDGLLLTSIRILGGVCLVLSGMVLFKGDKKQIWFVVLASFVGVIVLSTADYFRGGISTYLTRYLLINYIGFIMLFAFAGKQLLHKNWVVYTLVFVAIMLTGLVGSKNISDSLGRYNRDDAPFHVEDAETLLSGDEKILIISDYKLMGPNAYSMFMSLLHRSKNPNIDLIYPKQPFPDFISVVDLSAYDKVYTFYTSKPLIKHLEEQFGRNYNLLYDRQMYGIKLPVYEIINPNEP